MIHIERKNEISEAYTVDKAGELAVISKKDMDLLKIKSVSSEIKRSRILLHKGTEDPVQEMLIAFCSDSYVPPHRQKNMQKTYYMLEGELLLCFFEKGEVSETVSLSPDDISICRFSSSRWHTVVSKTDIALYVEVIAGPYDERKTEFAKWAPERTETHSGIEFLKNKLIRVD